MKTKASTGAQGCCLLLLCSSVLPLTGCAGAAPVVTGISPQEILSDLPDLALTVSGQHFQPSSQITLGGEGVQTTFVSDTELVAHADLSPRSYTFSADHTATLPVAVGASRQNLTVRENPVFDPALELLKPTPEVDGDALPAFSLDSSGTLYLAWHRGAEVFFSSSSDQGRTWSPYERFSALFGLSGNHDPALAIGSTGALYAVWTQSQNANGSSQPSRTYFARSDERGRGWTEAQLLAESEAFSPTPCIMTGVQGRVSIVLSEKRAGVYRMVLLQSGDGGVSWGRSVILEGVYASFEAPVPIALAADDSGSLFFTYGSNYQTRYGYAVDFRVSLDGGRSWGGEQSLLSFGGHSKGIVAAERGRAYASGTDMYLPYTSRSVLLRSGDSGANWAKTTLAESPRRSDLVRGNGGMLHLCVGNVFRRIGENGTRLFREYPFASRDVEDVKIIGDPQGAIFVVWQESVAPYRAFLTPGHVQSERPPGP